MSAARANRVTESVSPRRSKVWRSDHADLWDSGKVESDQRCTLFIAASHCCHGNMFLVSPKSGITDERVERWSEPAKWSMGLLAIPIGRPTTSAIVMTSPIATDTTRLFLPAARQYRKEFDAGKEVKRATVYATALGIYELHLNGQRVGDAYFAPGWTDYRQRAYYNTYDVTSMVQAGDNAIGAWVADGWYSGYVGFGLLTGMGTEKMGRYTYGKTPSVMVQLEIEYTDGTRETVVTDKSWKVTGDGPIQEADLLMGEAYDARNEQSGMVECRIR